MNVDYTGRQTEVSPELRALAERKLRKLQKVLPRITSVHVILAVDKHRQIAEVSVHSANLDLTAAEEGDDMQVALATVMEKLERQAQRHRGKIRERNRRAPAEAIWSGVMSLSPPSDGSAAGEPAGPRVIRSRRFVVRPMTVDEAVLSVQQSPEEFLVFKDSSTDRVRVIYKRKDGNLGLIEPEP